MDIEGKFEEKIAPADPQHYVNLSAGRLTHRFHPSVVLLHRFCEEEAHTRGWHGVHLRLVGDLVLVNVHDVRIRENLPE